MIKGIGIDMVEIDRIKQSIKRQPRFVQRILTENEYQRCLALQEQRQAEFAAGRFAAKEAFAKAAGTGIGALSFQDMEILASENGAPLMTAKGYETCRIWVSITHSRSHAVAQVVLEEDGRE
ncbi:holo-ACP synthase [Halobacillus litoralis]|uniref:holo-ACP synthase n=1 Tax=Halobacillus litoralis TaxID=45668 RepID=UPI001CD1CC8C|nr:holo-ACP synthase [Halobacillus litoralis]MCA1023939.1 holo-ACP synthase [Halobacillus litoralis]